MHSTPRECVWWMSCTETKANKNKKRKIKRTHSRSRSQCRRKINWYQSIYGQVGIWWNRNKFFSDICRRLMLVLLLLLLLLLLLPFFPLQMCQLHRMRSLALPALVCSYVRNAVNKHCSQTLDKNNNLPMSMENMWRWNCTKNYRVRKFIGGVWHKSNAT